MSTEESHPSSDILQHSLGRQFGQIEHEHIVHWDVFGKGWLDKIAMDKSPMKITRTVNSLMDQAMSLAALLCLHMIIVMNK